MVLFHLQTDHRPAILVIEGLLVPIADRRAKLGRVDDLQIRTRFAALRGIPRKRSKTVALRGLNGSAGSTVEHPLVSDTAGTPITYPRS